MLNKKRKSYMKGLFLNIFLTERQGYKPTFKEGVSIPFELSDIFKINVGYRELFVNSETKIETFRIQNFENEKELLIEFLNLIDGLDLQLNKDNLLIGYDIKKYILPGLLKKILIEHKIRRYVDLPNLFQQKEQSNVFDLKEEYSFGGYQFSNEEHFLYLLTNSYDKIENMDSEDTLKLYMELFNEKV